MLVGQTSCVLQPVLEKAELIAAEFATLQRGGEVHVSLPSPRVSPLFRPLLLPSLSLSLRLPPSLTISP